MSPSYKYFGTPSAPPTPPVFWVVLPHNVASVQRNLHPSVYYFENSFHNTNEKKTNSIVKQDVILAPFLIYS